MASICLFTPTSKAPTFLPSPASSATHTSLTPPPPPPPPSSSSATSHTCRLVRPRCSMVSFPMFDSPRMVSSSSGRAKKLQVVRMAPEEEKLTRRNPLDFPIEWERPKPGRRPDIFPQFSPMKTPLPPPLPYDPPEEDEEEEEKKEEEEEDPEKEEPEQPEKQ